MATFKICIFKHQKRQDNKYPVSIRICWKRQYAYLKTEYYVSDKQINKKTFDLKDTYLLNELNSRILKFENIKIQKLGQNIDLYSARDLAKYFEQESRTGTDSTIDFIKFSRSHVAKLKASGRTPTANTLNRTINALIDYANGRENIPITEITSKFLAGFETFLRGDRTLTRKNQFGNTVVTHKKGVSDVTLLDYMTDVRTLFNAAKDEFNDEDKNEIRIAHYPFAKYKLKRAPASKNRNLSIEQIRAIRDISDQLLLLPRSIFSRDMFMLSFYLGGTNFADLYDAKISSYTNGRFSYERRKTKRRRQDNAFISFKVEPEAIPLFEKYKDPSKQYVFDFYKRYSNSHIFCDNVNKGLKKVAGACGIEEPLSSYYARHSMATIARNDCDISKDDINLLLNHVDQDMKVTDIYLADDWSRIDKAIRKVLDLLSGVNELL